MHACLQVCVAPDELKSKIADALAEARQSQSNTVREVSWRGRVVAVKNEKLSIGTIPSRLVRPANLHRCAQPLLLLVMRPSSSRRRKVHASWRLMIGSLCTITMQFASLRMTWRNWYAAILCPCNLVALIMYGTRLGKHKLRRTSRTCPLRSQQRRSRTRRR